MPSRRRWIVLALGMLAQAATCSFIYGLPVVLPQLRSDLGVSLVGASLLVSAPIAGVLLTLIAWGALADHRGERIVITIGVGVAGALVGLSWFADGAVWLGALLVLGGAFGASVNAASGRMVMGWFPPSERGLAMGLRQTCQPIGVALAALVMPPLARAHGLHAALLFPAAFCVVIAIAVRLFAADPPRSSHVDRTTAGRSPYHGSWQLGRIHLTSVLLVVPQFAISSFTLIYLVGQRHWDPTAAGRVVFAFQIAGAVGRVVTGIWSDRVRSRLGPMRQLAAAVTALMIVLALGAQWHAVWILAGFALASIATVADNGLAYTAVAERAGPRWSGRALGIHNTGQNVASMLTAPALAAVIGNSRYALGFALVAVFPLLAVPLTPVRGERAIDAADAGPGFVPTPPVGDRSSASPGAAG